MLTLEELKEQARKLKSQLVLEKVKEANEYLARGETSRWEWVYEDHGHGHSSMRRADRCMAKPVHPDGFCDCFDRRPKPKIPFGVRMKSMWDDFVGGKVVRDGKLRSKDYAEQLEQLERLIKQSEKAEPKKVEKPVNRRKQAVEATKRGEEEN